MSILVRQESHRYTIRVTYDRYVFLATRHVGRHWEYTMAVHFSQGISSTMKFRPAPYRRLRRRRKNRVLRSLVHGVEVQFLKPGSAARGLFKRGTTVSDPHTKSLGLFAYQCDRNPLSMKFIVPLAFLALAATSVSAGFMVGSGLDARFEGSLKARTIEPDCSCQCLPDPCACSCTPIVKPQQPASR
ncbi:hypothetical protein BC835DRAFT_1023510 [Cytidiella melzeri]|nr:hypothetical protein BC835DRAFT_1023510 [Cytidiella melzeri]